MSIRFDLEQSILDTWHITDHLTEISTAINAGELSPEDASKAIEGLAITFDLKFRNLFSIFENLCLTSYR